MSPPRVLDVLPSLAKPERGGRDNTSLYGFTLLEVLMVSAILAVVLGGLGSAFVSAYREWDRQRNEITAMMSVDAVLRQMARDVATASEVNNAGEEGFTLSYAKDGGRGEEAARKITYQISKEKMFRQSGYDEPVILLEGLDQGYFYYDQAFPKTRHVVADLTVRIGPTDRPLRSSMASRPTGIPSGHGTSPVGGGRTQRFWTSAAVRAVGEDRENVP